MTAAAEEVLDAVFRRAPGVLHRTAGGGAVILLVRGVEPALLELAGSGAALWHSLTQPRSARDCAEQLAPTFGIDVSSIEDDIAPVLCQLATLGALEQRPAPQ